MNTGKTLFRTMLLGAILSAGCSSQATVEPPLELTSVATERLTLSPTYQIQTRFSGRIESRRQSQIGFNGSGEIRLIHAEEGDTVQQGTVLAELDTDVLMASKAEASAGLAQAKAELSLRQSTLERMQNALSYDGISRQEYDQAKQAASSAGAGVVAAQASIDRISARVDNTQLRAPYDAIITERFADEGQIVGGGTPVFTIQETAAYEARIGINASFIANLTPGETHSLEVNKQTVQATIKAIIPSRNAITRTVDVIFSLQPGTYLAGEIAEIKMTQRIEESGFWVPLRALTEGRRGIWNTYVIVPVNDAQQRYRVEAQPVEIIYQQDQQVLIRGAVTEGSRYIVSGLHRVVPGQIVKADW